MRDSVGKATLIVQPEHLAPKLKTGAVSCLSTAILAALMEEATMNALETASLVSGKTTVGSKINIHHKRPSALAAKVTAVARVIDLDKSGVHFEIEAFDDTGLVGTATMTRVFVAKDQFEQKCYEIARKARL